MTHLQLDNKLPERSRKFVYQLLVLGLLNSSPTFLLGGIVGLESAY